MAAIAKDTKTTLFVGVDVSKARLDVHVHPLGETLGYDQTAEGLDELVGRLKGWGEEHELRVIAIEATGGYESLAVAALAAAALPVVVVNPKQVHNYGKALGLNAKTDPLDAFVIARFAEAVRPEIRPLPDPETVALADLLARRRQIVQMMVAENNRALKAAGNKALHDSIKRILEALESEMARLDGGIDRMVKAQPLWQDKENLLASVPGIGKLIARTLLAELPELGRLDRREIAALAGLAPWTRKSGKWIGQSMIGGGRAVPRTVLYLGAMAAARHNPDLKAFSLHLLNNGKRKKIVLIAVARKLLTILNAILRDGTPWQQRTA